MGLEPLKHWARPHPTAGAGSTATIPAGGGSASTPAGGGSASTPAGGGSASTPAGGSSTTTPAGGLATTPAGGGLAAKRYGDNMVAAAQTQIVVAALIATIAFAAGFTVPGSYETNADQPQPKGAPILFKHAAFRAFLVTNTLAFVSSLASIFSFIVMTEEASLRKRSIVVEKLYDFSAYLLHLALISVAIAFVTGVYCTLGHSTAIAVVVIVLGLLYFPLMLYVVYVWYIN